MHHGATTLHRATHAFGVGDITDDQFDALILWQVFTLASGQIVQHSNGVTAYQQRIDQIEPMNPAPPVTRIGASTMAVVALQQARQAGARARGLIPKVVNIFLQASTPCCGSAAASEQSACATGVSLAVVTSRYSGGLAARLRDQQRRRSFVAAVMVGAPQRGPAIELLEHCKNDSRGVIHRRRIATAIVRQQDRLALLQPLQDTPQHTVTTVVEQPAETQQHMTRAQRPHALLDAPERLARASSGATSSFRCRQWCARHRTRGSSKAAEERNRGAGTARQAAPQRALAASAGSLGCPLWNQS